MQTLKRYYPDFELLKLRTDRRTADNKGVCDSGNAKEIDSATFKINTY